MRFGRSVSRSTLLLFIFILNFVGVWGVYRLEFLLTRFTGSWCARSGREMFRGPRKYRWLFRMSADTRNGAHTHRHTSNRARIVCSMLIACLNDDLSFRMRTSLFVCVRTCQRGSGYGNHWVLYELCICAVVYMEELSLIQDCYLSSQSAVAAASLGLGCARVCSTTNIDMSKPVMRMPLPHM